MTSANKVAISSFSLKTSLSLLFIQIDKYTGMGINSTPEVGRSNYVNPFGALVLREPCTLFLDTQFEPVEPNSNVFEFAPSLASTDLGFLKFAYRRQILSLLFKGCC